MQTDWDRYYERPFWASRFTRGYTSRRLIGLMRRYAAASRPAIIEYGGGNSCFYRAVRAALSPSSYSIVDSNAKSVAMFENALGKDPVAHGILGSVLDAPAGGQADIVFSAGLIEHFSENETRRAVATHFASTRPGGLVILTFPTPTWLYRVIRWGAEKAGRWAFPDERPLLLPEVAAAVPADATILEAGILWPLLLTQGVLAVRKGAGGPC